MFEAGDVRDAAEKAWCATKRATDALILARTGREPETSRETSQELRNLIHMQTGPPSRCGADTTPGRCTFTATASTRTAANPWRILCG